LQTRFPDVKAWLADLDDPVVRLPQHQIVYAYGVLYHLAFPDEALKRWAAACTELLLLETCVSRKLDFVVDQGNEDSANLTASLRGRYCRPGREWLWIQLSRLFPYVYLPITQPNHEEFPTDWQALLEAEQEPAGLLRAIFVGSRQPLQNPLLADHLLLSQTGGL
jgi:hypothetical protein